MDNDKIALSSVDGGRATYNASHDKNCNSIKFNDLSEEVFGSTSQLHDKKRNHQRRFIVATVIILLIGACIGATVAVVVISQRSQTELLPEITVTGPSPVIDNISPTVTLKGENKLTTTTAEVDEQDLANNVEEEEADITLVESFSLKESSENCPVKYKGKCYRALVGDDLNRTIAGERCQEIGWNLANVYSDDHFYLLEEYLRTLFSNDTDLDSVSVGYIMAWTGMTVAVEDQEIFLSNGENVTYSEVPLSECNSHDPSTNEFVLIELYETAGELYYLQGLWNCYPASAGNVALCEQP